MQMEVTVTVCQHLLNAEAKELSHTELNLCAKCDQAIDNLEEIKLYPRLILAEAALVPVIDNTSDAADFGE